jgi:Zn-dependent M28 family amino/carboxypeptidase
VFAFIAVVHMRPDADARWWLVAVWLFCLPLILSVVGARNHGTLDNASGVAAVLEAVEQLPRDLPIGVLISDAEELALAGAAAWARERVAGVALNVDSIDDDGELVLMYSGTSPAWLVSAFRAAAKGEGETMRVLRLIPGILTDHVALRAAGWETLTLSRGTIRTLQRIHTSRDTLAHMDGRGIAGAARVLARTVVELC